MAWVQILAQLLTTCVILDKSLNLSGPPFIVLTCQTRMKIVPMLKGCSENEMSVPGKGFKSLTSYGAW